MQYQDNQMNNMTTAIIFGPNPYFNNILLIMICDGVLMLIGKIKFWL